jgi:hypothetical protein
MKDNAQFTGLSFSSYENVMPTTFPLIFLFNITSFSYRSMGSRKRKKYTSIPRSNLESQSNLTTCRDVIITK